MKFTHEIRIIDIMHPQSTWRGGVTWRDGSVIGCGTFFVDCALLDVPDMATALYDMVARYATKDCKPAQALPEDPALWTFHDFAFRDTVPPWRKALGDPRDLRRIEASVIRWEWPAVDCGPFNTEDFVPPEPIVIPTPKAGPVSVGASGRFDGFGEHLDCRVGSAGSLKIPDVDISPIIAIALTCAGCEIWACNDHKAPFIVTCDGVACGCLMPCRPREMAARINADHAAKVARKAEADADPFAEVLP